MKKAFYIALITCSSLLFIPTACSQNQITNHNQSALAGKIVLLTSVDLPLSAIQTSMHKKETTTQMNNDDYGSIIVIDGKILLSDRLQEELQQKIILAKAELQDNSKKLEIDYLEKISIGYLHRGQDNWEIKFTFGGIILNTSEIITLSTEQVFTLKKFFQATDSLTINNHKYQTTRSMIQFGPILHERDFK
jgi:hypothetical protein